MDYQMVPENGQGVPERTPDPALFGSIGTVSCVFS
jgi:hypothetical protein